MTRNGTPDAPPRLACDGLVVGDFSVPPFRVGVGQAVCLHVPLASVAGGWRDRLAAALRGETAHPALRFCGSVGRLERPMPRRRWWGRRHDPSVSRWLTAERGLTPAEAADVLGRVALPSDIRIGWVGANERRMLALEACLLRPPDLLVFDTAGHDPLGISRILERVSARPPQMSVLYLKMPALWGNGQEADLPCLPGADCVCIGPRPLQPSAAE